MTFFSPRVLRSFVEHSKLEDGSPVVDPDMLTGVNMSYLEKLVPGVKDNKLFATQILDTYDVLTVATIGELDKVAPKDVVDTSAAGPAMKLFREYAEKALAVEKANDLLFYERRAYSKNYSHRLYPWCMTVEDFNESTIVDYKDKYTKKLSSALLQGVEAAQAISSLSNLTEAYLAYKDIFTVLILPHDVPEDLADSWLQVVDWWDEFENAVMSLLVGESR